MVGNIDNVYVRVLETFDIAAKHYRNLTDHDQLVRLLQKASLWRERLDWIRGCKRNGKWVPTIIVDIEYAKADTIGAIAERLKVLACDYKAARVMSEDNAHFALPHDPARQDIIWMNDLSEAEARALMDKYNFVATKRKKSSSFSGGPARAWPIWSA